MKNMVYYYLLNQKLITFSLINSRHNIRKIFQDVQTSYQQFSQ